MPVQEILDLAQQGHPTAIATLMNYITQPRGMKVRVRRQADELHILVEAEVVPDQQQMVLFVQDNLQELQVQSITRATLYGRQQGDRLPAWQQTIALATQDAGASSTQALPTDLLQDLTDLKQSVTTDSTESSGSLPGDVHPEPKTDEVLPEFTPSEFSTAPNPLEETRYNTASSAAPAPGDASVSPERQPEPVTAMDVSTRTMQPSDAASAFEADLFSPSEPIAAMEPLEPLLPADDTPEILKRPESVFVLFFVSIFMFWEAYVTLLNEEETKPKKLLSTSQLARRLKTSKSLIRRRKRLDDFSEWTRSLDPDGI
ncbi:MAG TPA: hypothetical protein V6C65_27525, partial [Allocoleopsis sp.]